MVSCGCPWCFTFAVPPSCWAVTLSSSGHCSASARKTHCKGKCGSGSNNDNDDTLHTKGTTASPSLDLTVQNIRWHLFSSFSISVLINNIYITRYDSGQMMTYLDSADVAFPNSSLDNQQLTRQPRGTYSDRVSSAVWLPSRSVFSGVVEAEEYVLFFA